MRIYSLQAPDGNIYDLQAPEGASEQELTATLYSLKPEAAQPFAKESGVIAQGKKGIEQLVSGIQTTGGAIFGDKNEAARDALARQAEFDKKYEQSPSLDRTAEAFKQQGFFSGLGQLASDAPDVLAAQIPQFGLSYAGGRAGAAAGSKLGSVLGSRGRAIGALLGGAAGTVGASYPGQLAGNIETQAEEQISKDKPIDINLQAAATAAAPQAALDAVANLPFFGRGVFGKMLGIPEAALIKGSAESVERLAKESLAATVAKGTALGFAAEFPTEIIQQAIQRYQAGKPLTSPEAYKEYGEIAYQTALLSPLGTAGRALDKRAAKADVQQKAIAEQQIADAEAQKAAQEVAPVQPQDIAGRYQAAEKRKAELKAQIRKVEEGSVTETADRLYNKELEEQIKAMAPELEQLATEYNQFQKTAPAPEAAAPEVAEAAPEEVKPARALTVGDSLDSPLGRFTKEELTSRSPKIAAYVDMQRKKMGKPGLNDYSIEDLRDAMPGQLPEAEKADLNSLIAAKTGYTGEVIYKPEDVVNIAKQKNINTDTVGFKYFLQRATGDNDLSNMSQPQLHSAFKSLSELPKYEETQNLPEKSSATHYSPEQYKKAVETIKNLTTDGILPSAKAQAAAKQASGLKRDSDVQYMLQSAYRNGDLDLDSQGNFIRVNPAPQSEFRVEEGFEPAEPTGFNVMRGDKVLFSTQNEAEAKAKAKTLGDSAAPTIKQVEKSIANEQKALDASQRSLDAMEANGLFGTPEYNKASAKHTALVEESAKKVGELSKTKEYLQQEVTVKAGKKAANVKAYTTKEKGVSEKSFATREEALQHAIENHTVARLNEIAAETKSPGLKNRISKELERRKGTKPFLAAEKPVQEPVQKTAEKPAEKPLVTAQKESIKSQLLPMLKKFGLGDVALQIEEGMKAEGSYTASTIKVALDANNPIRVLRHESLHGLKDLGFFTKGQWAVLENQADKVWIDKYLKERNIDGRPLEAGQQSRYEAYVDLYQGDMQAVREEAIADAFGDFDVNGAPKGVFTTLLNNMRQFFEALRNSFNGAGYMTSDDVFGKIERGELKATKKAGTTEKPSLIRRAVEDEKEISTQNPQAKGRLYDPLTDMLSIDEAAVRESMQQNPELERNIINAIKSYGFIPVNTKDEDVIKVFKDNIVSNLLHLHDRVPKDVRERSKLWYDGANKIASELADKYDMNDQQVAGILAAMSPQKDWFQNVSMAERAIDILTNYGDATWTPDMLKYAESYISEAEDRADRDGRQIFFDKRIKKMSDDQVKLKDMNIKDAAAFVRAYDEAFNDRKYNIVTPEGGFGGTVMNKNPDPDTGLFKPATMMWSTYSPIEKTVSIFRDPSRKNISEKLGEEHKIRSFYNNIVAPNSPIGHVTIDTHAVAAALYESLAGTDPEVTHNFGGVGKNTKLGVGGTYGLIAEAYREAAAKVGLKPREMQSVTWEAVRGMFPENIKSQIKQKVRDQWTMYRTGEQTFEKTRSNIEEIGDRADSPDWVKSDEGIFVEDGGSSFDVSFKPEGGVRLRKANEIKEKATVNLSAVTGTIPGLQELHTRALNGDAKAYEALQKVAASTLRFLLSGTKAKISFQQIKGVYEEGREPAIMAQINFRESESDKVLGALSRFGLNFNQEAIHVRTKTKYKAGHTFDDGSYATPVYTIPLKEELTEQDIVDIVNKAGLKGFSVSKTELIAYHVQGELNDISEYDDFLDKVRGVHATYGAADKRLQQGVQRLAVYGDGYGARTRYKDIASDFYPKQVADRETPRIIAEYLNEHPIKPFEQKPLTKSQKEEQTVLKDVFEALPVNDLKKPIVRKAYAALAAEVKRQYQALPIKVELTNPQYDKNGNYLDIYENSAEVRKDVSLNNRFRVLKTNAETFGPEGIDFSGHPLLESSGLRDVNGRPMLYNDLLRAVHDYFAHNLSDTEFGPKGEFAAWKNHMATTKNPLARWALTQETRAQNAWQNFRPEVENLSLKDRGFAQQKAALPPATFALTGDLNVDAPMVRFIESLNDSQKLGSLSPKSKLVNKIPTLPKAEKASLRTAPDTPEFKRFFGDSRVVNADGTPKVMYHGLAKDTTSFKRKSDRGAPIFLTDKPEFAERFAKDSFDYVASSPEKYLSKEQINSGIKKALVAIRKDYGKGEQAAAMMKSITTGNLKDATPEAKEYLRNAFKDMLPTGPHIMPVYVRAENPFNYANTSHVNRVLAELSDGEDLRKDLQRGSWETIESEAVQDAIKFSGFDSFYVLEHGVKNLAVYDSSQLKSVTGNVGAYGQRPVTKEEAARSGMTQEEAQKAQAEGDVRYSLRTDVSEDIKNMPNGAAIFAAINRTTQTRQEVGFIERITEALAPESFSYLRQKGLDRYNRLSDVERLVAQKMGGVERLADSNAHAAALQSDLAAGVAASALGVGDRIGGIPVYKDGYTTVSNEGGTVKGAVEIFAPLARYGDPKMYQAYQFWAASKRGKRLLASGKEELFTPQDFAYAKQLEQKYPEFVSVQKDWIKYNDGLVKYAVDTGVISAQNAAEFVKYSDYLPFYRQIEGERTIGPNIFQSISGVKAPKKITGSEAPLADFLETIVRNTQATIQAGMKNVAAKKAADAGVMIGMVQKLDHVSSSPNTITILEKGQKVSYECADRLWVDAVSSLNLPELPFLSIFAKPADLLRNLVTKDPGFMLANLMRDSVSAYVTSGAKITPLVSTMKEFGSVLMNSSPEYQKLLSAGVLGGYEFSRDIEASTSEFAKDIRKKTGTKTTFEKAASPFTFFWNGLEKGTNASDAATRIAIYKATLKETGNEAEALHRSLEVMNFNRKGSSAVVRIAAAVIPFLNARVQGLDVFFRSGIRPFFNKDATAMEKQVQKAMFIRGSTIMAMSAMYAAAIAGNPDYENQEEEVKDNNWIIPLGEGKAPLKIPIPFEVGTLFKTIPERIYRSFYGMDTNKDSAEAAKRALSNTFGLNPIPQIAAPLIEVQYNYSMFTHREIVSGSMKDIAPEYQVGANTSKVAQEIGMATGMSPMKLEYVYKGYTGTMGMYALDLLDASITSLMPDSGVQRASKRFEQMPVIKRFLADPDARGKITAYYDLKNSVDSVVRTINFLEKSNDPSIADYAQKNAMLYAAKDFINSLNKDMQDLQDQANMIRAADIPADQKRDILLEITKAQNLLVNDIRAVRKVIQP